MRVVDAGNAASPPLDVYDAGSGSGSDVVDAFLVYPAGRFIGVDADYTVMVPRGAYVVEVDA